MQELSLDFYLKSFYFLEYDFLDFDIAKLIRSLNIFTSILVMSDVAIEYRLFTHRAIAKDNRHLFFTNHLRLILAITIEFDYCLWLSLVFNYELVFYNWFAALYYSRLTWLFLKMHFFFRSISYLSTHFRSIERRTTFAGAFLVDELTTEHDI